MLHSIDTKGWTDKTAWCVPTSISFLTGIPLIHSHSRAAFIQSQSIDKVKGVHGSDAAMLLKEQGYRGRKMDLSERYDEPPKLTKFLKDRSSYEKCMPIMVRIEDKKSFRHMIAIHFDYAADNWTMKPVMIEKFPHKTKYVTDAWIVEKDR